MENILVMFGGVSSEHEVSIISGLQVVENIDKTAYNPIPFYIDKKGQFFINPTAKSIKDYANSKLVNCDLVKRTDGTYVVTNGLLKKQIKIDCAYVVFHGGEGENGSAEGFLDVYDLPYTCCTTEGAVLCMNKAVTKEVLRNYDVKLVDDYVADSYQCLNDSDNLEAKVEKKLGLPVIVKPVHLGSTIGISVAHTKVELKKAILEAGNLDTEILFEKYLNKKAEYNVSVRRNVNEIVCSVIERPKSKNEILTFKDKYAEGGTKKLSGMAILDRDIPAKLDEKTEKGIIDAAKKIYAAARCSGNVRIDFIQDSDGQVYLMEINPIPGAVAFFLWEAAGVPFKQQITDSINQAIYEKTDRDSKRFEYESDIVEKFLALFKK